VANKLNLKTWKYNLPRSCNESSDWSQCQSNQNLGHFKLFMTENYTQNFKVSLLLFVRQPVDLLTKRICWPWKRIHFLYVTGYVMHSLYWFSKRTGVLWGSCGPKGFYKCIANAKVSQRLVLRGLRGHVTSDVNVSHVREVNKNRQYVTWVRLIPWVD